MPKLSYPRITKGEAVYYLLRLYWNEPEFMEQLQQLHQSYVEFFAELAVAQVKFSLDCKQVLSPEDYHKVRRHFYDQWVIKGGKDPELPRNLSRQLQRIKQMYPKLQPYFDGLGDLAYRWKLRAPWAVLVLYLHDMRDFLKASGMPENIDVPLEELELLYPWPPPVPALEIKVPAWALIHYSRKQIEAEIAMRLKDYESRIKAVGLKEYPSALENHARWWFEHYVKEKTYAELEEQFPRAGQETIKRKVWNFSKLAGIKTR